MLLTVSIQVNISRRAGARHSNITGLHNIHWFNNWLSCENFVQLIEPGEFVLLIRWTSTFGQRVSYLYVLLSFLALMFDRAFIAPLFHSFTHDFINFRVFVCGVQHLGNLFICPNVDEAFHLLTAPSQPASYFHGAVVMELSHNAKHDQRAWGSDIMA